MSEWKTVKLGDIANFTSGGTPSKKVDSYYEDGVVPWITGADISEGGLIRARARVTETALRKTAANALPAGSIALVTRTSVGKVGIFKERTSFSQDITGITPHRNIDTSFLVHFLKSRSQFLKQESRGATIKGVPRSIVSNLTLSLPSPSEQRRIASILDKADVLRAKRHSLLTSFSELEHSAYGELFANSSWDSLPLGESVIDMTIGLVRSGKATGPHFNHQYMKMDGITPSGRLDRGKFTFTEATPSELTRYSTREGDLLLNTRNSRELVGKTAVFRGESALFNNNLMRIRFDSRLLPDYVHAYLWSPEGQAALERIKSGTTSVFAVYAKDLAKLPIPAPPIAVQSAFSVRLDSIRTERDRVYRALEADNELFAALQHRAFRGEL